MSIGRSQRGLLARSPGLPPGGDRAPWSIRVAYSAPAGTVLTISVATGGHVAGVERFAVTGVRAPGSPALADGRYAARITKVDPVARRVTVDLIRDDASRW